MGKYSRENLGKSLVAGDMVAIRRTKKLAASGSKKAKRLLLASGIKQDGRVMNGRVKGVKGEVKAHSRKTKGKGNTSVKRHSRKVKSPGFEPSNTGAYSSKIGGYPVTHLTDEPGGLARSKKKKYIEKGLHSVPFQGRNTIFKKRSSANSFARRDITDESLRGTPKYSKKASISKYRKALKNAKADLKGQRKYEKSMTKKEKKARKSAYKRM